MVPWNRVPGFDGKMDTGMVEARCGHLRISDKVAQIRKEGRKEGQEVNQSA